jgi:hypothetical protein
MAEERTYAEFARSRGGLWFLILTALVPVASVTLAALFLTWIWTFVLWGMSVCFLFVAAWYAIVPAVRRFRILVGTQVLLASLALFGFYAVASSNRNAFVEGLKGLGFLTDPLWVLIAAILALVAGLSLLLFRRRPSTPPAEPRQGV